jgi:hypothetical protein
MPSAYVLIAWRSSQNWLPGWRPSHTNLLRFFSQTNSILFTFLHYTALHSPTNYLGYNISNCTENTVPPLLFNFCLLGTCYLAASVVYRVIIQQRVYMLHFRETCHLHLQNSHCLPPPTLKTKLSGPSKLLVPISELHGFRSQNTLIVIWHNNLESFIVFNDGHLLWKPN